MPPLPAFTLSVPADEHFRELAASLVKAYLQTTGNRSAAAEAFVATVSAAAERLASHGDDIDMVVNVDGTDVDVQLSCGAERDVLKFSPTT